MFGSTIIQLKPTEPLNICIISSFRTLTKSDINFQGISTVGKYLLKHVFNYSEQIKTSGEANDNSSFPPGLGCNCS